MESISAQFFKDGIVPELLIEDLSEYETLSTDFEREPYELGQEIKEEGKHLLEIVVKYKAGNVQTIAVEFTIDMTPPKADFGRNREKRRLLQSGFRQNQA